MASRGELEQRVLELLWESGEPMTVAAVHKVLHHERDLAYTTVMTVLDRLAKKKLVTRTLVGRAWDYSPALSQEELVGNELLRLLNTCSAGVQPGVLDVFAAGLDSDQAEIISSALTSG